MQSVQAIKMDLYNAIYKEEFFLNHSLEVTYDNTGIFSWLWNPKYLLATPMPDEVFDTTNHKKVSEFFIKNIENVIKGYTPFGANYEVRGSGEDKINEFRLFEETVTQIQNLYDNAIAYERTSRPFVECHLNKTIALLTELMDASQQMVIAQRSLEAAREVYKNSLFRWDSARQSAYVDLQKLSELAPLTPNEHV